MLETAAFRVPGRMPCEEVTTVRQEGPIEETDPTEGSPSRVPAVHYLKQQ